MKKILLALAIVLVLSSLASALTITSVFVDDISPGEESTIRVEIENNLEEDAQDVSLVLSFTDLPFIPVGTSEESAEEIEEGEEEDFVFRIRASNDATAGNYEVPFTLTYEVNDEVQARSGTFGVQISADPDLTFTVSTDSAIIGNQGTITLNIINRGLSDARFVSVRVLPEDFTLVSDSTEYIGEVESDDFETVSFDVLFTDENPSFNAIVTYRDFNNKDVIEEIELPVTVYTRERALALGIIQPSYAGFYIALVIILVILLIVWRIIRKRRRLKNSMKERSQ
jgi:hypothetical protein